MEFWTQFLSEYANAPNGFALTALGATIAAQSPSINAGNTSWMAVAVPLLLLLASVLQVFGGSLGARAMGGSVDTKEYWTATEKWIMMHFFNKDGYTPSMEGWKEDVFCLAKTTNEYVQTPLFAIVGPLQKKYLKERDATSDPDEKFKIFEKHRANLMAVRDEFYGDWSQSLEKNVEKGWLVYEEPSRDRESFFTEEKLEESQWRKRFFMLCVVILCISFWACIVGIYNQISLSQAVSNGLSVLSAVQTWAWASFAVFWAVILLVYHVEVWNNIISMFSILWWTFTGCKVHPDIETRFETPHWDEDYAKYGTDMPSDDNTNGKKNNDPKNPDLYGDDDNDMDDDAQGTKAGAAVSIQVGSSSP